MSARVLILAALLLGVAIAAGAGIPALILALSLAVTREAWARTHRS